MEPMIMTSVVTRRDEGPIATLTLTRPGLYNAFGLDMAAELVDHLRRLEDDRDIRVVVLTGDGKKAFCSGANLQDTDTHRVESVEDHLLAMRNATRPNFFADIVGFRKPIVCAVNGFAIGAGFLLTICCDVIVASTTARFKLPQTSLGILPAFGGTARLAQWIGRGRAMDIAITGRWVEAEEAHQIGLATQVVEPDELMATAYQIADVIAAEPELAVALTKESLVLGMEEGALMTTSINDLYRFLALSLTDDAQDRHRRWRSDRLERRATTATTADA